MDTWGETIEVQAPDGPMPAALCRPRGDGVFPGVLVIMEAYGLTEHIRDVGRRLAAEGYVTLAPDLYYRQGARTIPYDDTDRAIDMVMRTVALSGAAEERVKDTRVVADLTAAYSTLQTHPGVSSKSVGLLGFSMGGRLAFLLACRLSAGVRASVSFYGGRIVPILDEARTLDAPLLLVFAGDDPAIPFPQVDRIRAELEYREREHEIVTYAGASHGFFCQDRAAYHPEAASGAWARTLEWLAKHLA